jgi:subtilisin family serine protease
MTPVEGTVQGRRVSPSILLARSLLILISFVLFSDECNAGVSEAVNQSISPALRARQRQDEIIVIFGNGTPGRGIGDKTPWGAKLVKKALADSRAAETAIERAGGVIRFRYRTALVGFNAIVPKRNSGPSLLQLKFHSGSPGIALNWETKLSSDPSEHGGPISNITPVPSGLDRIGQRLLPLNHKLFQKPLNRAVHVYVLDSGVVSTYPEFGDRLLEGYDTFMIAPTRQCMRHGTLVAGIIGSASYGVAPDAFLHSVRIIDCEKSVDLARAIKGIDWTTSHYLGGRRRILAVANLSFEFRVDAGDANWHSSLSWFERAVSNSIRAGITYVAAAGNHRMDACLESPARVPKVITVGSVNPLNDWVAASSNFGQCLDLFAPGVNILSVGTEEDHPWDYDSGTSLAAPHVAGVAAIILANKGRISPYKVWRAIRRAATDPRQKQWCGLVGRRNSRNILLHWGAGSQDGRKDAEAPPPVIQQCES